MKIKALEAKTDMRFTIPNAELEDAEKRLRMWQRFEKRSRHGRSRTKSRRRFSVFRDGKVRHSKNSGGGTGHYYHVRVDYIPATELTWRLIQPDMLHINSYTDLPFRRAFDVEVTPSGLRHFRMPWKYTEGSRRVRKDKSPQKGYCVEIRIMGFLDDKSQIRRLRDMVDALYLPVKTDDHFWQTDMGSEGTGGSHPTIVLDRRFKGDITPNAEKKVTAFYDAVRDFVLEYEITEGFRFDEGGKTWAELLKEHDGSDMHDNIARSTAANNGFYAPHLRIDAYQPIGEARPELRYGNGKYRRENRVELMILNVFADTEFIPKV